MHVAIASQLYMCMSVNIMCLYIYMCVFVCVHVCVFVCVCLCVFVCGLCDFLSIIAPMDYTAANLILVNIPAGNLRFELTIPIRDDDLRERSETFLVQASFPNKPFPAVVEIIDNDRKQWILMIIKHACDY